MLSNELEAKYRKPPLSFPFSLVSFCSFSPPPPCSPCSPCSLTSNDSPNTTPSVLFSKSPTLSLTARFTSVFRFSSFPAFSSLSLCLALLVSRVFSNECPINPRSSTSFFHFLSHPLYLSLAHFLSHPLSLSLSLFPSHHQTLTLTLFGLIP